ncbi:MAG: DUF1127 domain-containing protein [Planktotalea sp.]|uniref:DUF1127 domain-containing protein n=1 Tax=Planktotalea sp. TaxID=2029877 RepID=UPI003C729F2F
MAFFTETLTNNATFGDKLAAIWQGVKDARMKRAVFNQTLNELSSLSTRELNDLGLSRSMIRRIAYEAAYQA